MVIFSWCVMLFSFVVLGFDDVYRQDESCYNARLEPQLSINCHGEQSLPGVFLGGRGSWVEWGWGGSE